MIGRFTAWVSISIHALALGHAVTTNHKPDCTSRDLRAFPYCNESLPTIVRAKDLVKRLTPDEKARCLHVEGEVDLFYFKWPGVPRLGVPWVSVQECLHGVGEDGFDLCIDGACPTSFPLPIGMGASFNESLWAQVATAISSEARAWQNLKGNGGVICWGPNINLARDPRWGRTSETLGEDPFLTARYLMNFIPRMQGAQESKYLKVVATCKHAIANNLDFWCDDHQPPPHAIPGSKHGQRAKSGHCFKRSSVDEQINAFDLASYFLPAWQGCLDAGARSIMMSENAVNGKPDGASKPIMDHFRTHGFRGFFTTDCGGIDDVKREGRLPNFLNATAAALTAGISLECPAGNESYMQQYVPQLLADKIINVSVIDEALEHTLSAVIDLGVLDPPEVVPWTKLGKESLGSHNHRQLALEAAQQSLVLVRNQGHLLPLSGGLKLAVVGPHANTTKGLLGAEDYNPINTVVRGKSILIELSHRQFHVQYAKGCELNRSLHGGIEAATDAVRRADVAVVVLGLGTSRSGGAFEGEGDDRFKLSLPQPQIDLLRAVAETGTPVVLVMVHGGALSIGPILNYTTAIVDAFYPGEFGGVAVAQLLAGEFSPSAALPVTYYQANYTKRNMTSFDLRSFDGTTYQYYKPSPVFQFGAGLSYTNFTVSSSRPVNASTSSDSIIITNTVSNIGKRGSAISLLAFIEFPSAQFPLQRLGGFSKIFLDPGHSKFVTLSIPREALASTDEQGTRRVFPGRYVVRIRESMTVVRLIGETVVIDKLEPAMQPIHKEYPYFV